MDMFSVQFTGKLKSLYQFHFGNCLKWISHTHTLHSDSSEMLETVDMGLRVHDKMTSLQEEKCLEINAYSCGIAGIRNQEALPVRVDMVAVVRSAARLHTDITVMRDEVRSPSRN